MSSGVVERKNASLHDELVEKASLDGDHPEVLAKPDLMSAAFDGENREHEMGVWEAAKSHPWACFWAFVMCFTIVSTPRPVFPVFPVFPARRATAIAPRFPPPRPTRH